MLSKLLILLLLISSPAYAATCVELGASVTLSAAIVGCDVQVTGASSTILHSSIKGALDVDETTTITDSIVSGAINVASAKTLHGSYNIFEVANITGDGSEDLTHELWSQVNQFRTATNLKLKHGSVSIKYANSEFTDHLGKTGTNAGYYQDIPRIGGLGGFGYGYSPN